MGNLLAQRLPVRRTPWIPKYTSGRAYMAALVTWLPLTAGTAVLAAEGHEGWAVVPGVLALAAHFVPVDMLTGAASDQDRSASGLWALRAQLWLLLGGAFAQALRDLRR